MKLRPQISFASLASGTVLLRHFYFKEVSMEALNVRVNTSGEIRLMLPNQKPRNIGWFSDSGDTFHCQRNPAKHLHNITESFGFNHELLRDGSFKWIVVHLPFGQQLITSRTHVLQKGFFQHYKQQHFERQLFLHLADFGIDRARETEKRLKERQAQNGQQNLFGEAA